MSRIIEMIAFAIGGLSLFVVCFVGFAALSGKDVGKIAVIGGLFPAPPAAEHGEGGKSDEDELGDKKVENLSDAAVIEASLGVLSAWTLPSPYSTSELRVLSEEIKKKHAELEEHEHALERRERAVHEDELELEERVKTIEDLRKHLEEMQKELAQRELALQRGESAALAGKDARWGEIGGVIAAIEEPDAAAKRLQEYEPEDAAKILRTLGDDTHAREILNQVETSRWKDYVDAYTAEKARAGAGGSKRNK